MRTVPLRLEARKCEEYLHYCCMKVILSCAAAMLAIIGPPASLEGQEAASTSLTPGVQINPPYRVSGEVTGLISVDTPPDAPQIHGPMIYGSWVRAPFQLAIAATGQFPMRFMAKMLPMGLQLDQDTGVISGKLKTESASKVSISASNKYGTTTTNIEIVPGPTLALTPPLGWNCWDSYGDNITESEFLANASAVAQYLKPHGWQYVVVDGGWYDPLAHDNHPLAYTNATFPVDQYGRLIPAVNRWPSSAGGKGFKLVADKVHAMGLKFGLHIWRGLPRAAVEANTPIMNSDSRSADIAVKTEVFYWYPFFYGMRFDTGAGQAYYDSLFEQFAQWGVDFVKVDHIIDDYSPEYIHAIHKAIAKCGRPMIFSASAGPLSTDEANDISTNANMWRITGDFWDSWGKLDATMDIAATWSVYAGAGHWPDLDILPLGHISVDGRCADPDHQCRLTHNEQVSLMTLWSIAPSPLMVGASMVDADPWLLALLTNDEVLAVNQDVAANPGKRIRSRDNLDLWVRDLHDGSKALALFNRSGRMEKIEVTWRELGLAGPQRVRDLWQRKDSGVAEDHVVLQVASHGAELLRLTAESHAIGKAGEKAGGQSPARND